MPDMPPLAALKERLELHAAADRRLGITSIFTECLAAITNLETRNVAMLAVLVEKDAEIARLSAPVFGEADRIDYDDSGNLDDVVVDSVLMFRMEWMDDDFVWIRCYRRGENDVVFWLKSAKKIEGRHEYD